MVKNKLTNGFIIGTFITLYVVVSLISTIHVIDFFKLSNPEWLAVSLAIAFEIGAAASLAALIALNRMSKWMVWTVFIILACMQMMGNTYYAFTHLHNYEGWSELFGLNEEDPLYQKRILSIISGAVLPLIALGFIKSLVDYIRPAELKNNPVKEEVIEAPTAIVVPTPEIVEAAPIAEPEIENEVEKFQHVLQMLEEQHKKEEAKQRSNNRTGGNPQVLPGVN